MSAVDTAAPHWRTRLPSLATLRGQLVVEQRLLPSPTVRAAIFAGSLLGALLVGAALLAATGYSALDVYDTMVMSSFGSSLAFSQTIIATTPLILTSLAAAVAFRMRLYTIGADGQVVLGAICASGIAIALGDDLGAPLIILLALGAGVVGGALWAAIAGIARAFLGTSEILSTLMLNFVAVSLMTYLVIGSATPWRDPASVGQPSGRPVPDSVLLPPLFDQADVGILIAVAVAVAVWVLVSRTRWGFELRVVGDSPRCAAYAGISVRRKIVAVMLLSGALAGLAGAIQVTNVTQALDPQGLNPGLGLGFAGIVVATLGRLSLLATIPLALLVGALLSAGPGLELSGVPNAVVVVLQGTVLLLVAGGQFLLSYRIRRTHPA